MRMLAPYLAEARHVLAVGLAGLLLGAPVQATPTTAEAVAELSALDAQLSEAVQSDAMAALAVMRPGLDVAQAEALAALQAADKAEVALTDLRIILAQMSRSAGANNQLMVLRAQAAEVPKALTIKGGTFFLQDLITAIDRQFPDQGLMGDNGFNLPVVIWSDATLVVPPGAMMALNREAGAFLTSFGKLHVAGAQITTSGAVNPKVEDYRPFVAVVGTGWAELTNARFTDLGFGKTAAFSGVSVIGGGLFRAPEPSVIIGSVFEHSGTLSVQSTQDPVVQGNAFLSPNDVALSVRRSDGAVIRGNLFLKTGGKAALRLSDGSRNTIVRDNTLLQGQGNGIELVGTQVQAQIMDNLIWNHKGVGVSVDRSDCVTIGQNTILRSGTKGISVKTSRHAKVLSNQLYKGRSSAIHVSQQPDGAQTLLQGNVIAQNRIGLSLSSAADVSLQGNDLTHQFPRLLEGDVAFQAGPLLQDLHGAHPVQLTSTSLSLAGLVPVSCPSPHGEES